MLDCLISSEAPIIILEEGRRRYYSTMAYFQRKQNNNNIINQIRNNDPSFTQILISWPRPVPNDDILFSLLGDDWEGLDQLGECIGRITNLTHINLYFDLNEELPDEDDDDYDEYAEPQALPDNDPRMKQAALFCRGLAANTSIQSLYLHTVGNIFSLLNPFFKQNQNLNELVIHDCKGYYQWYEDLISALRDCVSLKCVKIINMELQGEESGDIFRALRLHQPHLQRLYYPFNSLNRRMFTGVEELTYLLRDSNELHTLDISHNGIVGESLQEGLLQYLGKLRCLNIGGNMLSVNDFDGYQALATLLEDPTCKLEELHLKYSSFMSPFQGERLRSFATAMTKNRTLRTLDLGDNSINAAGWDVFSDVLCNTSSINNTYNSNHTLMQLVTADEVTIENRDTLPGHIEQYLTLNNQHDDKKKVAAIKIMQYHWRDIPMHPFFEWELKCLPVAVNWFDNVPPFPRPRNEIEMSKLQAIYEFVRDMPMECADGYFGRKKKGSKKRARS